MTLEASERQLLLDKAKKVREEIVLVTEKCGGSHLGGALSQTDVMVALYYKFMKFDPKNPSLEDRDRFILSKGHGGVGHAVILGDLGYFDTDDLKDFIKCYNPKNRHKRRQTKRFKSFTYDELLQRDKVNLDIFWIKDESLEDTENLPEPEVLAMEIVENLEVALDQFRGVIESLEGEG